MIKFNFYKLGEYDWVLSIVDQDDKELHKILYNDISIDEITQMAISLAKGNVAEIKVDYTRRS